MAGISLRRSLRSRRNSASDALKVLWPFRMRPAKAIATPMMVYVSGDMFVLSILSCSRVDPFAKTGQNREFPVPQGRRRFPLRAGEFVQERRERAARPGRYIRIPLSQHNASTANP